MRPNKIMIPKSCRLFGPEHATEKRYGEIAEAWAAAGPLPLRMTSGGGARPFADMRGLG
jgi:hypothetical protein